MLKLSEQRIVESKEALMSIPEGKVLINTINAHSYNTAQKDDLFAESLETADNRQLVDTDCVKYLIPDGASIIMACRWLDGVSRPKERIAGWNLFEFEMQRLETVSEKLKVKGEKSKLPVTPDVMGGESNEAREHGEERRKRVMFMGSSEKVLGLIKEKAAMDYPHLEVVTYSPPYKPEFSDEDNAAIVKAINEANPDLLWIGMTAPKQEKWTYRHWGELDIHCHVGTIGAVFDFYAGTARRAPLSWQKCSLEWLYRLIREPRRMWRRYLVGNPLFLQNICKERMMIRRKH